MSALPIIAQAAKIMREAVRDKSYRRTPIGQEAGRFLRSIRSVDLSLSPEELAFLLQAARQWLEAHQNCDYLSESFTGQAWQLVRALEAAEEQIWR